MLKKINVEQLRVGMHIEEMCGSWLEHPFWRTRFTLREQRDLDRMIEGGVREVWIDTSRGNDIDPGDASQPGVLRADVDLEIDALLAIAAGSRVAEHISMTEELDRAGRICRRARGAVVSMFAEARMGKAIDSGAALSLVDEISGSIARNPGALVNLARLRTADDYTFMHSVAVCALMISLGRQLKLDEDALRSAGLAGLLHDMGKAMIDPIILNKPGKLTEAEFDVMRHHPQLGHSLLAEGGAVPEVALDVCLHHHERIDGTGYPHGLDGSRISLFAKMGAVCDVYDAITSNRPYKTGWDPAESIRKMAEWSSGHFDESVFHAFVKSVGIYPVGSLVRMESGRLAVVTELNETSLTSPVVKVFFSIKADSRIPTQSLDLARRGETDHIVGREDPGRWQFRDLDSIWASA